MNRVVLFFLATKAAMTPPKIAHNTPPIAIIACGFSIDNNANTGETMDDGDNPTVVIISILFYLEYLKYKAVGENTEYVTVILF